MICITDIMNKDYIKYNLTQYELRENKNITRKKNKTSKPLIKVNVKEIRKKMQ